MTDNSRRTGAALEAHYQFLAWLVPTIERVFKSQEVLRPNNPCTVRFPRKSPELALSGRANRADECPLLGE
jgi:hypothetical protein